MYESPIEIIMTDIQHQIAEQQEEQIYKAVVSVGINVDKKELLRALQYDRGQYSRGYVDAMDSIVRCKNCVHRKEKVCANPYAGMWVGVELKDDDFCSYGERRNDG